MASVGDQFAQAPARGVMARAALGHWQELLEEWCLIHERYCRLVREDAIYWSIERSNLAALAGAAWRAGWAALEEFPQEKTLKRSKFAGRADLFMKSPTSEDYVEAKMTWVTTRRDLAESARGVVRDLDRACRDAAAIRLPVVSTAPRRIGVVFAVPYFSPNAITSFADFFTPFFEELSHCDLDALAWCFPSCARDLAEVGKTDVHPGIVLLARVVAAKKKRGIRG